VHDLVIRGGTVVDGSDGARRRADVDHISAAGGRRLIQRGRGDVATVRSGVVVRAEDGSTGERPGRLRRGPRPAAA
jgi:N-acyl-D-amino-acid deacylase